MSDRPCDKSAQAFRTISEVANELGLATHVLRFWESKFPQIKPTKRAGGRRYYRPDDVALLRRLQSLLHDEGYTIKGVQKLLREDGARKFIDEGYGPAHAQTLEASSAPQDSEPLAPTSPQASLFDAPPEPTPVTPTPLAPSTMAPSTMAPSGPLQADSSASEAPERQDLRVAPHPAPLEEPAPVIHKGLTEAQRAALSAVLSELELISNKLASQNA